MSKVYDAPFYFYPIKPMRVWPEDVEDFYQGRAEWVAEPKINEWRAPVLHDGKQAKLWNRDGGLFNGGKLPKEVEPIEAHLSRLLPGSPTMLDGGIVNQRTKEHKGIFVVFDVLMLEGEWLGETGKNLNYLERRALVEELLGQHAEEPWLWILPQERVDQIGMYNRLLEEDEELYEGIVLKQATSTYPINLSKCVDVPNWVKCKKLEDHRKEG